MTFIEDKAVVLFQGDSITDGERNREDPNDLGRGYAMIAAAWFQALYPEKEVRFLNRGIGGNSVVDLHGRWQEDTLDLQPTWVSILIGINDNGRPDGNAFRVSYEEYEARYREILDRTREQLHARLILCEPFLLLLGPDQLGARKDLEPRIQIVRQLAREYGALYVPFDGVFAQASTLRPPAFWAGDAVHPSPAGHALMAQSWLRAVKAL